MTDFEQIEYAQCLDRLRAMLAETEFNSLWTEGREMLLEEAIQFALDFVDQTM